MAASSWWAATRNSAASLASAELYDPVTASWTATGEMHEGRGGHSATLLADGRVLVAGGYGVNAIVASAELYDPITGSWTATAGLGDDRQGYSSTLLPDGRVLVAGGYDFEGAQAAGVEILARTSALLYDPKIGRWTPTGDMTTARGYHTTTLLRDGTVLVTGGGPADGDAARSAELYDPDSGRWTLVASMAEGRFNHTATLLPDGTLLVAGGDTIGSDPETLASAERYDPAAGTWTNAGRMSEARVNHTATLLNDGSVLVAGDFNDASEATVESYRPDGS